MVAVALRPALDQSADRSVHGADPRCQWSSRILEDRSSSSSFPALPKRRQRYLLPLKSGLTPGLYVRARIDVGNEIQEASASVKAEEPHPADSAPEV